MARLVAHFREDLGCPAKRATNGDFIKQIKLMRIVVSQGKTNGFFTKFNLYMFLRRKLTCPHDEAFDCYRLAHFWKETDGWMAAQDWPNQIWCYPPVSTNVAMGNPLWMDIWMGKSFINWRSTFHCQICLPEGKTKHDQIYGLALKF